MPYYKLLVSSSLPSRIISKYGENKSPHVTKQPGIILTLKTTLQYQMTKNGHVFWHSNEKHISFRLQGKRTISRLCPTVALSKLTGMLNENHKQK